MRIKTVPNIFIVVLVSVILALSLGTYFGYWLKDNYNVQFPIVVRFQSVLVPLRRVIPKKTETPHINAIKRHSVDASMTVDETIADYIRSKNWDYSTAIRIAKSENAYKSRGHFDCQAIGHNTDGSVDRGIFQINSVHDRQYSPSLTLDCFKNIDVAYKIYSEQGWTPWVTYTAGYYLNQTETL